MAKRTPLEMVFWNFRNAGFPGYHFPEMIWKVLRPENAEEFRRLATKQERAALQTFINAWPTTDAEWERWREQFILDAQRKAESEAEDTLKNKRPGVETFRKLMAEDTGPRG